MAEPKNTITAIPGKIKDFLYPKVPLKLPTEQFVLKNGKVYPSPQRPAPNFGPEYGKKKEYRKGPVKNYEITAIRQPDDLYVDPYGEYKEAGRINMRSAMAERRRNISELMTKYPQSRSAGRNLDQDILNSRFLPILDPMASRSDIDALRDYYRKGGDYSKPVATVKSRGSIHGVAHVSPQEHIAKPFIGRTAVNKLTDRQEIFPGIVSRSLFGAFGREYDIPGSIFIAPSQGSPYGQTLALTEPSVTASGMRAALEGGNFGPDLYPRFSWGYSSDKRKKDELAVDNRVHNLVRRHETGHVNAPYFVNMSKGLKPLNPILRGRDVKEFDRVHRDRREINEAYANIVGPRISKLVPISNDIKDDIATYIDSMDAPGLLRGGYFNNPAEATGAFNQWKSNYAIENYGAPAPRTLDELIQAEVKRGAVWGPADNMRTVPSVMYSKGKNADWNSGIDGILQIRSSVNRAVRDGRMSKEEADKILKRMDMLYRMSHNSGSNRRSTINA